MKRSVVETILGALVLAVAGFFLAFSYKTANVGGVDGYEITADFSGTGQFKFSLVNGGGTTTFWSNDGTGLAGSQPTAGVSLAVSGGLYNVLLGDATVPFVLWLTAAHPMVVLTLVILFLCVFAWLARRIWRLLRNGLQRLRNWSAQ